jgi:hypothetical protein
MRIWIVSAAAVIVTSFRLALASGCFGGEPDISPRNGSTSVPSNARVTVARRSPASLLWVGPGGRQIIYRQRQAGSGPSAARILMSDTALPPGVHTIRTTGPDMTQSFTVTSSTDSLPPSLTGTLMLEAFNAPEPSSECPENIFIRAGFPAPHDDRTDTNNFIYLVWIRDPDGKRSASPDLVLPAESIVRGQVFFRFGETGCGCIPRVKLRAGASYRITLRAVDIAGNESTNTLSGLVTVPFGGAPRP